MNKFTEELLNNKYWLWVGGILLIFSAILLCISLLKNIEYTLFSSYVLAGVVSIIQGIKFWYRKWFGLTLHLGAGLLDIVFVLCLYFFSNNSITLLIYLYLFYFIIIGIFRTYTGLSQLLFYFSWVFTLICGLINIFSAIFLICFPTLHHLLIVCFLDFFFTGVALLALGININYRLKLANH